MKKFIVSAFFCAMLIALLVSAPIAANASTMAMKNWQQDEPSVPGYVHGDQVGTWWYKQYGGGNFGDTGCGIMSLVNAVHYVTGNFMDPLDVADWAYARGAYSGSYGTERELMYPYVEAQFGEQYQFTIVDSSTYGRVDDTQFINHMLSGGTAVVHVQGHFMAIVDYDAATQEYLLWDNCAGDGRGGHRAGATHIAGDWLTADELEGDINATYLTVDWYCLIASSIPASSVYEETTSRSNITLGFNSTVSSGNLTDTTAVALPESRGMMLTMSGWHGTTQRTKQYGYSIDNGAIVYDNTFAETADQTVQNAAVAALGSSAFASKFNVSVPLYDNKAHTFKIYAKDGTHETCIWTINKSMNGTYNENTYFVSSSSSFYMDGSYYGIRIYQNSTADASYAAGWGGMDGISNKTISKDGTIFVIGSFSLKSQDCRRIGFLVDGSYIVWPEDRLYKSSTVMDPSCFLTGAENLGSHGYSFNLSFDTATLSAGVHTLKLVMDLGDWYMDIGTRTSDYGGGCFVCNATSSGARYVAEEPIVPSADDDDEPSIFKSTDVNNDGEEDVNDVIYLMKHLFNPEAYPIASNAFSKIQTITFNSNGDLILTSGSGKTINLGSGRSADSSAKVITGISCDENGSFIVTYSDNTTDTMSFR